MIKRPMFACSENVLPEELSSLEYPVYVTDKLDGIRGIIARAEGEVDPAFYSRSLTLLPNQFVQTWAETEGIEGMDGEIIVPDWSFNDIQSWVMSEVRLPINWLYYVFDYWKGPIHPYLHRMQIIENHIHRYSPSHTRILTPLQCNSPEEVLFAFNCALKRGKEGIIIRSNEYYKSGRSTRNEGLMLKMKHFEDAEAQIIGFEPQYKNLNPKTKSNLGLAKRSSHKANKIPQQTLGAFIVRDETGEKEFKVAGSMTDQFRRWAWVHRKQLINQWLTYKWQVHGTKHKPRTPIFKGIRRD